MKKKGGNKWVNILQTPHRSCLRGGSDAAGTPEVRAEKGKHLSIQKGESPLFDSSERLRKATFLFCSKKGEKREGVSS